MAKYIFPTLLTTISLSLLSGCVTQSYENNEPIVKTQANRDEMAATRVSLGLGYLKMGDMSQAKLNLEKAKRFSPNLVQVHAAFAHYYETVGEETLAVDSFEQALTIKADSADTLNNYGVFLCRQGKVEAAEAQFLKAIAVPSYLLVSQSYENLASCYLQNDNFEKAEMYLDKAISHSPNRTATLLQMVRLQYAMGDYKEGKRYLQRFERNTQRFTADSLALAYKLYWKLGQRRTASNYANMLVKMYPQSWEGKQYLLNELEFIEADNLARKYQTTQKESNRLSTPSSNKRVVKLSPKKSSNSSFTSSNKADVSPNSVTKQSTSLPKGESITAATTSAATLGGSAIQTTASVGSSAALVGAAAVGASVVSQDSAVSKDNAVSKDSAVNQDSTVNKDSMASPESASDNVVQVSTESSATQLNSSTPVETTEKEVTQALVSTSEPTSTQPVPAKRDAPLPEALPAPVPVEVEPAETVMVAKEDSATKEVVDNTNATPVPVEEVAKESTDVVEPEAEPETESVTEVNDEPTLHTVSPGENLYNISVKYNVKLKALRKWNNISEKNNIRIGDKLYVVDPQTVKNINE